MRSIGGGRGAGVLTAGGLGFLILPTTCTAKPSSQGHDRVLAYLALLPPDPVLPEDAVDLSVRRGA